MGIFSNVSPLDEDIERATSENNTSEQWDVILELCDRAAGSSGAARAVLRGTLRRLAHQDPHVAMQAATLLDACVANSGRGFLLEVASREFEADFRRLVARAQPAVSARLRALLRKWADNEFSGDPQLDLVPALATELRADKDAPPVAAPAPALRSGETDDLARAIALSLQETPMATTTSAGAAPMYPRVEEARPVRALYDFEAAEDNELTFFAGEIVHVTDSSDPNWWKGFNSRGSGLFPANFVSEDAAPPSPPAAAAPAAVAPAASVPAAAAPPPAVLSAAALDAALAALHAADPEAATPDPPSLARAELAALAQAPLVDAALQRADTRHARLTQLSAELVDALNLYHDLMRSGPPHLAAHQHQHQHQHQHHAGGM